MQGKFWAVSSVCLLTGAALLTSVPVWANEEAVTTEQTTDTQTQTADTPAQTPEKDMATVTAEGDFLLPTYMLPDVPEATEEAQAPMYPQKTITRPQSELPVKELASAKLKKALGVQPAPQSAQTMDQIAAETNDAILETAKIDDLLSGLDLSVPVEADDVNKPKKSLLLPIRGQIKRVEPVEETTEPEPQKRAISSDLADKVLAASSTGATGSFLMPQDLKVTFYPNATDFSGQTIKWIKAFSIKAARDPRYIVEIRLSVENPPIQQKRLYVIQNILANNGLSPHQLAVTYVDRPENSLVLRIVKKGELTQTTELTSKTGKKSSNTLISW